jgi:Leucine-rich repeat (LRR) protein
MDPLEVLVLERQQSDEIATRYIQSNALAVFRRVKQQNTHIASRNRYVLSASFLLGSYVSNMLIFRFKGDMTALRELYLNNNQIRVLPYELGKLFKLIHLGLKGNPLTQDLQQIYCESNGTQKLLIHLLDQLTSRYHVGPG